MRQGVDLERKSATAWDNCPSQYIASYRRALRRGHTQKQHARSQERACCVRSSVFSGGEQGGLIPLGGRWYFLSRLSHEVRTAAELLADLRHSETLCQQTCRETLLLI